jgi:hypothetical protein
MNVITAAGDAVVGLRSGKNQEMVGMESNLAVNVSAIAATVSVAVRNTKSMQIATINGLGKVVLFVIPRVLMV